MQNCSCSTVENIPQKIADKYEEYTGIREMRKHVAWYTAGFPHSAKLRKRVNEVESMEALEELLQSWE